MRRRALGALALAAVALAAVGLAGGAGAQDGFQPDRARLLAIFRTLEHGENAFLSGQLRHLDHPDAEVEPHPDRRIVLEESPYPHTTWTAVAETTTDQEGYFSFTRTPAGSTRYRVRADDPPVVSEEPIVRVRVVVEAALDRTRVERGRRFELSGTVAPAHDGMRVLVQREDARGRWRTVARPALVPDPAGGRSAFRARLRATRSGEYRVRAPIADGDHLPGMTGPLALTVVPRRR